MVMLKQTGWPQLCKIKIVQRDAKNMEKIDWRNHE